MGQVERYLRGIPGLRVLEAMRPVPTQAPAGRRSGRRSASSQSIARLSRPGRSSSPTPRLYVTINGGIVSSSDGMHRVWCAFNVSLKLKQLAVIGGRPPHALWGLATTWDGGSVTQGAAGALGLRRTIERAIATLLDEFQNEYLKANPDVNP